VRASRETLSGTSEERLISQIWSTLGVDPKTTPDCLTLGELGMESLFAIELQQGLEHEYEIKLSLNEVKNITVKQMKDFQSGNKQILACFSKNLKLMTTNLNKVKFIIPEETHTKLNAVQNGNPIYFLPPVEGIFSTLENLAKKINRPVIGLNWTRDMKNLNKMKEISDYYLNLLKKLSPNGNYDVVGYSFGGLIARKMLTKGPVGRVVIIDILSNPDLNVEEVSNEYIFESSVKKFFLQILPEFLNERIQRTLNPIKDSNEKLKKICSELKEFGGKSLVDKDMEEILRNTLERGKLLVNYRINSMKKFKQLKQKMAKKFLKTTGKLFIIKPLENSNETNPIGGVIESYYLPEKV
jgi:thioesterase domain-containing protein/acyl carrier protein